MQSAVGIEVFASVPHVVATCAHAICIHCVLWLLQSSYHVVSITYRFQAAAPTIGSMLSTSGHGQNVAREDHTLPITAAYALLRAPHLCSKLLLNHARMGCACADIPLPAEICAARGSQVITLLSWSISTVAAPGNAGSRCFRSPSSCGQQHCGHRRGLAELLVLLVIKTAVLQQAVLRRFGGPA